MTVVSWWWAKATADGSSKLVVGPGPMFDKRTEGHRSYTLVYDFFDLCVAYLLNSFDIIVLICTFYMNVFN